MKKRLLSAFLSLCIVLTMMPAVFAAEASTLPDAVDGVIQLTQSVTITGNTAYSVPEGVTTLDLKGFTLTVPRLDIKAGTALTITDSSENKTGKLTSSNGISVVIWDGGSLTVAGGTIENTSEDENAITVFNLDTIKVNGGTVKGATAIYNTSFNGTNADGTKKDIVEGNVYCTIDSGTVEGTWAICAFGLGVQEDGSIDNEKVQININGGTISVLNDGQGIATNASSGIYAGFTIQMTDGMISAEGAGGCGMYLPAVGKTTISGGTIKAGQAIRIAAGELDITGGTIEGTAAMEAESDLISGGSGGTQGAVVVGKASAGYVGDIKVTISNGATVKNSASDNEKSTPAVVVSDKNMTTDTYKENSIDVNITGANIQGDIIKVSNLTPESTTQDGGATTLTVSDSTVAGDILNQSKDGDLAVSNSSVTGQVVNASTGKLSVNGGDITGNVENQKNGSIIVADTKVTGSVSNSGTEGSAGTVAILGNATVSGDKTGEGIFVESEADESVAAVNVNTGISYAALGDALSAAADGDTIRLVSDIKGFTNESLTAASQPVFLIDKNITIDGNGKTLTAGTFTDTQNPIIGIQNPSASENGVQVTIQNLTISGNETTGHGINVWAAESTTGDARPNVILNQVTVNNCGKTALTLNNSVVEATNLSTSGNVWGAVNVDDENSMFTLNSGTLNEPNQIWTEINTGSEGPGNISLPADWKYVLMNKPGESEDDIKYHATTDITKLGEAYNETANTVFDTVDRALENANASQAKQTVTVIKSAEAADNTTVGSNVTLVINQDVTLGGNLANEGTIENKGTITGDITNSGSIKNNGTITGEVTNDGTGTMLSTITFNVTPSTAAISVQDSSGNEVTGNGSSYELNLGTYTYTVTASGYYSESDSFTVDGTTRTIDVQLRRVTGGTSNPGVSSYMITVPSNITGGSISVKPTYASKGSLITITVNPEEGYELDTLTVLDKDSNKINVKEETATKYTFTMPGSKVTVNAAFKQSGEPTPSDMPFTDVSSNEWYYDAVKYVYDNGMMNGIDSTTFSPNNTTTRGMIVTILHRLEGEPSAAAAGFTDVASGQWYTDAIAWAAANDIVNGYSETEFGPNDTITREQMAAILYRYASFKGYDVTATASLSDYTDAALISGYATAAMQWANAEGLITGVTNTTLNPQGNATRAEVATILMRFCETIAK